MTSSFGFVLDTARSRGIFAALFAGSAVSYAAVTFDRMLSRLALMSVFVSSSEEAIVENRAFRGFTLTVVYVEMNCKFLRVGLWRDLSVSGKFKKDQCIPKWLDSSSADPVVCLVISVFCIGYICH